MTAMGFGQFFHTATGYPQPYPYQAALAQSADWPELLEVPTGLGKTGAVTLAWLYKRGWRKDGRSGVTDVNTPRRLLWCLPMRVLVEQTQRNISAWLEALNIHGEAGEANVSVHLLMGGEADLKTWAEHPEEDMILIGTQDMLLSRALMRGYGMSRYQWPVHFALLHNDCLWAYDEVQLMGAGMATSAQLEAFRRDFPLGRGSRSLWLSATLDPKWLATVDLKAHLADFSTHALTPADRALASERLQARKSLFKAGFSLDGGAGNKAGLKAYLEVLRDAVLQAHEPAGQTLLILNQVERAQGLFQALQQARPDSADLLIHARFRAPERRRIDSELAHGEATDRIIVATQAIEAGVDMSAKVLFTELAPWSSLVQRFGRCNRYGEHSPAGGARIVWIDITPDAEALALPYEHPALATARTLLESLTEAGPAHLPPPGEPRPLTPVLRRKDLLELFNTDADLSGFDVDIADYIRDTDNPGLQVFWRYIADPNAPQQQPPPGRDELCPVSMGQVKSLLNKRDAWRWDALAGRWQKLRATPRPGMVLLLAAQDGGYDPALGLVADAKQAVTPVATPAPAGQERYDADWRSCTTRPVLLTEHLAHAAAQAAALCQALDERAFSDDIIRASRWHDVGKAHQVFDKTLHSCEGVPAGLLAKSPCQGRHERPGFRHELASALAWLAQQDVCGGHDRRVNRIAYLIAAHHGKVRMSLRAMPSEKAPADGRRFARGIWEGDVLPALEFDTETSQDTELSLALMELGEGEQGLSWTARTLALLGEHGPFQLAWLECLVRIADWRASAREQAVNGDAR